MGKAIAVVLLFISTLFAQYPGAIATDSDLLVAKNRAQTTLTAGLNASATSFTVATGSKFEPNVLVTIDSEIMKVCSVVGNTVSVGDSSCPNIDGRGLENTVAASHSNGALVSAYITAGYHEALKNEIIAIETALGANLANVAVDNPMPVNRGGTGVQTITGVPIGSGTSALSGVAAGSQLQALRRKPNVSGTQYEFSSPAVLTSTDFAFSAQTCNGSNVCSEGGSSGATLVNGVGATLTLTPCPLGVNGSDTGHYLYVSGGVGTAEAVLITGGTCTSGASSGTVTFTPGQGHSGAWTVQSATAGIQEAVNAATANGGVGAVRLPAATHTIYSAVAITSGVGIECAEGAEISSASATANMLYIQHNRDQGKSRITGCIFTSSTTRTGGAAIVVAGASGVSNYKTYIADNHFTGLYDAIDIESAYGFAISHNFFDNNSHIDIHVRNVIAVDTTDATIDGNTIFESGTNTNILNETGGGVRVVNNKILGGAYGYRNVLLDAGDGGGFIEDQLIASNSIEGHTVAAISFERAGPDYDTYAANIHVIGNQMAGDYTTGNAAGIRVLTGGADNSFSNIIIASNLLQNYGTSIEVNTQYPARVANNIITPKGGVASVGIKTSGTGLATCCVSVANNTLHNVATNFNLHSSTTLIDNNGIAYASLPSVANGSQVYCSNCNSTCTAGGSTGRMCFRENGAWTR